MSDIEMKIEVEAEDFAEELNDEALDRDTEGARASWICMSGGPVCAGVGN